MTTKENIAIKTAIPFPSMVTTPSENKAATCLAREIIGTNRDVNNVFDSAGNVHFLVRNHYVNLENGDYGIESLISRILTNKQAVFPANIAQTEFAAMAKDAAMFSDDIIHFVRQENGSERYTDQTIRSYLSYFMKKSGKVQSFKLTANEDKNRTCPNPRNKFYLVDKAAK